jgi:hypothetical protein
MINLEQEYFSSPYYFFLTEKKNDFTHGCKQLKIHPLARRRAFLKIIESKLLHLFHSKL